jgi:hypothetical protein
MAIRKLAVNIAHVHIVLVFVNYIKLETIGIPLHWRGNEGEA